MADPWLKFYPSDWRSDPRLRMCSLAARGLWIEMIALMHEATPYGHLLVSGLSPTDTQLAVLAGTPSDQIPDLIGELSAAGVFSRTGAGVIYSRKMTRMAKQAALSRKNGKMGGNPKLCEEREIPPPDNPPDKPGLKTQKPEARSQTHKENKSSLCVPRESAPPHPPKPLDPGEDGRAFAASQGMSAERIERQAERFRNHFAGRKLTAAKRDGEWRNWVLTDLERYPPDAAPAPSDPPDRSQAFAMIEAKLRAGTWLPASMMDETTTAEMIRRGALTRTDATRRRYRLPADEAAA